MQKGIIICTSTNTYLVEENEKIYKCLARGKFKKEKINLLVGDNVEFTITNSEKQEGVIEQILPRKNELKRPKMSNLTQIILVVSMKMPNPDLLLLDNNVLASCQYDHVIDEIKKAGFTVGSTFVPPNMFEIAVKNLKEGYNERGYIKTVVRQYKLLIEKYGEKIQDVYDLLEEHYLLNDYTAKKEAVFETYDVVKPLFEEFYKRKGRKRYVDFNQGIDSRLINDANMEKMFEIPVRPVRIAFDHWKLHERYEEAVRTAVRHGHTSLSNYVLYNFEDKPLELYWRLKLNVDLCEELGISIYSFPMKYHPIEDPEYFSNRDYIGLYWNRKFIRTIQAVLNSTKGKVGKGKEFFEKAFGKNDEEFKKLLLMPEAMIIYRFYFEEIGLTDEWWEHYSALTEIQKGIVNPIIYSNIFDEYEETVEDEDCLKVLSYYRIRREDAESAIKGKFS